MTDPALRQPFPQLEDGLAVAGQLGAADLAAAARMGFRSVICNRPDGEVDGQASAGELAAVAAAHNLQFRCIPVLGSAIEPVDIAAQRAALRDLPRPILAYCRSGNRCTILWALALAAERPIDELLASARAAGYDLDSWRARLQQQAISGAVS